MGFNNVIQLFSDDRDGRHRIHPELVRVVALVDAQVPFPRGEGRLDNERAELHRDRIEAQLAVDAPALMAKLFDFNLLWSFHLAACYRIDAYRRATGSQLSPDAEPDLIYAVAMTPCAIADDGAWTMCPEAFALKRKWFKEHFV